MFLESAELSLLTDKITKQRLDEFHQVIVPQGRYRVNLRPLLMTAYGYQILNSLGLGTECSSDEFEQVKEAVAELGLDLKRTAGLDIQFATEISNDLRKYIEKLANYNSEIVFPLQRKLADKE